MSTDIATLTILFEAPFWIGLYEREEDGRYTVCKILFGAEPSEEEVFCFLQNEWGQLRFSPAIPTATRAEKRINPKRMQRLIQQQTEEGGIGTKAQQALKLQQEQGKQERKTRSRLQREEEQQRQFALRQEKRKEKHRGH